MNETEDEEQEKSEDYRKGGYHHLKIGIDFVQTIHLFANKAQNIKILLYFY